MLELLGGLFTCCDGVTRRNALRIGTLGLGGLTLPQILAIRAQAAEAGRPLPKTSVIFIELAGGPTHIETYDPKPDAAQEYRGPFGVVSTSQPGIFFSQLMVQQARVMDKLAIIRSIHHDSSSHGTSSHLTQTGYYLRDRQSRANDMPCAGSVTARLRGSNTLGIPAYISLQRQMRYGGAAYIGKAFNPFVVSADPNRSNFKVDNLGLHRSLTADRISTRKNLLAQLDTKKKGRDTVGASDAVDKFTQEAFEMVAGSAAQKAFKIDDEPEKIRDQYGRTRTGQEMLLCRRLIEAGEAFVTTRVSSWDDHNQIDRRMKQKGPAYDQGVAALIEDLYQRGLDKDVLVVAMGEFGRTPRVNRNAGRDHWGRVMSVLISGGGLRVGQIVGASSSKGEVPADQPYRPENVLAMVYRHLGIDPRDSFKDLSGRPRYILEERGLIDELI